MERARGLSHKLQSLWKPQERSRPARAVPTGSFHPGFLVSLKRGQVDNPA